MSDSAGFCVGDRHEGRLGKLPGALDVAAEVEGCLAGQGFASLEISVRHAQRAGGLAWAHRDPFDRMLVAQAQLEDVPSVSRDHAFDGTAVTRLWERANPTDGSAGRDVASESKVG